MSSVGAVLVIAFAGLSALGVPFAISIGAATVLALVISGIEPAFLAQHIVAGSQSFSLIAVPLFMLAGELMTAGGISRQLVNVASVLVRHRTGGFAMVTVVAAAIFSAISGSATATTAAIGGILIPAMIREGYSPAFATSIAVSSGVLGPLIPPSIAFVIWGTIAQQSISRLFLAGIVPGIAIGIGLIIVCYFHARRNNIPRMQAATWPETWTALWQGRWALFSPIVVLGGIYGGVFTPTEAAGFSCVYALLIGFFVERKLTLRGLPELLLRTARMSVVVVAIVGVSTAFGVIIAQEQVATKLADFMSEHIHEKWMALAMLNIGFFLLATVMDELAIIVIFGPMLIALSQEYAINPIQFGAMIVTNVATGMAAPPVGYCLFIGMAISGLKLGEISRVIWPQILVMLIVLFLTTYIPAFSLLGW